MCDIQQGSVPNMAIGTHSIACVPSWSIVKWKPLSSNRDRLSMTTFSCTAVNSSETGLQYRQGRMRWVNDTQTCPAIATSYILHAWCGWILTRPFIVTCIAHIVFVFDHISLLMPIFSMRPEEVRNNTSIRPHQLLITWASSFTVDEACQRHVMRPNRGIVSYLLWHKALPTISWLHHNVSGSYT